MLVGHVEIFQIIAIHASRNLVHLFVSFVDCLICRLFAHSIGHCFPEGSLLWLYKDFYCTEADIYVSSLLYQHKSMPICWEHQKPSFGIKIKFTFHFGKGSIKFDKSIFNLLEEIFYTGKTSKSRCTLKEGY